VNNFFRLNFNFHGIRRIEPRSKWLETAKSEKKVLVFHDHQNWQFYICSQAKLIYWSCFFLIFFQVKAGHVFSINNRAIVHGSEISRMSTFAWHACCYNL